MLDVANLPDDVAALKAMLIAAQARETAKDVAIASKDEHIARKDERVRAEVSTALPKRRMRPQLNRSSIIPERLSLSSGTPVCTEFISTGMNNVFADADSSPFFLSSPRHV